MQRLTELPAEDRLSWRAQALIRAMGATVESEDRLLRVRRLLDKPPRAAPRWRWRVARALGLLRVAARARRRAAGHGSESGLLVD